MTDPFAALGFARRPWLDDGDLKDAFHQRSAAVHPDRVHGADEPTRRAAGEAYAALNLAHQQLRDPKERLLQLVRLERGRKPGDLKQLPDDVLSLFASVGSALKQLDAAIQARQSAATALLKVRAMQDALPQLAIAESLQQRLNERRAALLADLRQLDAAWNAAGEAQRPALLDRAEELYHLFGFLDRWAAQLRERFIQLTL